MIYRWRNGAHQKIDAQVAGERLEDLRVENDGLTARVVLDDAKSESSPLHEAFEWDDARAADEYRLEQARDLMASVTVVVHDHDEREQETRAFVVVTVNETRTVYTSVLVAMGDPSLRAQVIERAVRELGAWQRKYRELTELADLFRAIESQRSALGVAS